MVPILPSPTPHMEIHHIKVQYLIKKKDLQGINKMMLNTNSVTNNAISGGNLGEV